MANYLDEFPLGHVTFFFDQLNILVYNSLCVKVGWHISHIFTASTLPHNIVFRILFIVTIATYYYLIMNGQPVTH